MPSTSEKAMRAGSGRPIDMNKSAAIISAARDQFFQIGFAQASMESIAAQAGVSKVTVYNRFSTKEALFTAVVEAECDTMRESLNSDALYDGDLRQTLTDFGMNMSRFLARDEMTRFEKHLAVEAEHNPAIGKLFLDAGPRRLHSSLTALLDHAVSAGQLRIHDTAMAAEHLAGMIKGLSDMNRRFRQDDPNSAEKTKNRISSAVDLFLKGYACGTDQLSLAVPPPKT